ncbi:LysR family transcriptional regulator [Pelistega suis]|uniref:LysR family transcriptional regulator n=1 Tax=Pelistega suis TaxID=1631957 RepID=UPI00211BF581|nr:LysR family transcriptional regulator [Pelistega suis]MCQ9329080.1 LysR family transcriptional regulator [Pelistega suis]
MLTFKQIDALYWTASLGSFSSAAEKLHTTQSAITKRIKELEAYFQVEVFNRSSKKVVLTPKGEEVYQLAIDLINKRDSMLYKLTANNMLSGTLRLSLSNFLIQRGQIYFAKCVAERVNFKLLLTRIFQ